MRLLLVLENKEIRELLSFQIASLFSAVVKELNTCEEAAEFLKKEEVDKVDPSVDVVLAPFSGADNELIRYLKSRVVPIPAIYLYEKKMPDSAVLRGLETLGLVEMGAISDGVSKLLSEFTSKMVQTEASDFCPIRTTLLIRVVPLKSDIFVRLSKDKFVKLFHAGTSFTQEDLQKYYQDKKIEYMYLRESETVEFTQKFIKDLDAVLAKNHFDQASAMQTAEMTQETVHELIQKVGFSAEVQSLAKKNVALTMKAIGNAPKLSSLLSRIGKGNNYISQHSTLLAHVACCVAKEMQWGSDSTFSKLVLASYMHDISLQDQEIAKVNTLAELAVKKGNFHEEAVKGYHLHPVRSADVVKNFQEIPPDVDVIVLQHHERPGGDGFPRGLAHNYIAPLASVFIIAHDLTQDILDKMEKFNIKDFIDRNKDRYNQGNFKKIMQALVHVKLD